MKSVLVVGACGGMGRAVCRRLCESGYTVWGIDCAPACKDRAVRYVQADVTSAASLQAALAVIRKQTDSLYALVYMAGIYRLDSLLEISEEELKQIFEVNCFGLYRVNKIFCPLLHRGSRIVVTSSELAPLDPLPFNGLYSITKATVEKYAVSLRMEMSLAGIHVSVLRPGAVKTGLLDISMAQLNTFCNKTVLYQTASKRFLKLVNSVEAKAVPPERIARCVHGLLRRKHPPYVVSINRNPLLLLLNALPDAWQVAVIRRLLRERTAGKKPDNQKK